MGAVDVFKAPVVSSLSVRVVVDSVTDQFMPKATQPLGSSRQVTSTAAEATPVRDVDEVMRDCHMHERGMVEWIEHDEIGRIVVPTTPLRIHGADPVDTVPSPKLGQHNREIYCDWLGLSATEIAVLEQDSVI
jgi:CoA:oxalate CoA-transferase